MLTLSVEDSGSTEDAPSKERAIAAWNETVSAVLANTKIQGKLDKLELIGLSLSCADVLKIATRACSQLQAGTTPVPN